MADINSGLPIRSQIPGQTNYDDVIVKIGDATNPSTQQLVIDASGRVTTKLNDGNGNSITSTLNGAKRGLDVHASSAGPATPGAAASFSDLIGGVYNSTLPTLTDGQQAAIQVDSRGRLWSNVTNLPAAVDTNYGTVGTSTIRVASQIGNATGAADYNFGVASGQTLRVASLIGNATGAADFNYGAIGAQTLRVAAQLGNAAGAIDYNYGTVGAQTVRVAAQLGNATGANDYGNGATGAQTPRVAANLAVNGANVSASNPVPVYMSVDSAGTEIDAFDAASAVAGGSDSNHDYTVTAGKTLLLTQIEASASGKMKIAVQIETGVATGVFQTRFVQFNSTANPNLSIKIGPVISVAAGVRVRIVRSNKENQAQDLYSTIMGQEIP